MPSRFYLEALQHTRANLVPLTRAETNAANVRADREQQFVDARAPAHFATLYKHAPELATARDALMARLGGQGPSRLESRMEQQAYDDLALRGQLTPEEERLAQQSARGAFAARGMSYGNPAAVAEVLNRQQFAQAREGTRRQFGLAVEGIGQQRQGNDRAFASSAYNQLFATLDPYRRVFGAYSQAGGNPATLAPAYQMGGQMAQYNLDVHQQQMQRDMQQENLTFERERLAQESLLAQQQMASNRRAGIFGGIMGAAGEIGGAAIGAIAF
jgi:hypothetical protein